MTIPVPKDLYMDEPNQEPTTPDVLKELVIPTCGPSTTAQAPELALLLDRMRTALAAINSAGSREHRAAAIAMNHLEFEIAPVLETFNLDEIVDRIFEAGKAHERLLRLESEREVGVTLVTATPRVREQFTVRTGPMYPGQTAYTTIPAITRAVRFDRLYISPSIAPWFAIEDIRLNGVESLFDVGSDAVLLTPARVVPAGTVISISVRYKTILSDGVTSTEPLEFHGVLSGELDAHEIRFSSNIGMSRSMGAQTIRPEPCDVAFFPTRLSISEDIAHMFVVESLLIGDVEQYGSERPGLVFSSARSDAAPTYSAGYDDCPIGTRVALRVRYTGPIEGGQLFQATLSGPMRYPQ